MSFDSFEQLLIMARIKSARRQACLIIIGSFNGTSFRHLVLVQCTRCSLTFLCLDGFDYIPIVTGINLLHRLARARATR